MWQGERVKKNESSEILIPGFNPSLTFPPFSILPLFLPSLSLSLPLPSFSPYCLFCDEEIATTKKKKQIFHVAFCSHVSTLMFVQKVFYVTCQWG